MDEDFQWLRDLHKKVWKTHPGDPYTRNPGWSEDLTVASDEFTKFAWICEVYRNELVFNPGSGVWGFGISLNLGHLNVGPYPNVPNEVDWLICLTSKQMFPEERGQSRKASYAFVTEFVYTDQNKKMREEAGLTEPLRELWYYDY